MSDKEQAIQIAKIEEHSKNTDEKLGGVLDTLVKILEQTTKHNGRMKKLEIWKATIVGGGKATKGLWTFMGVFVIAMIFGTFKMYTEFQIQKQEIIHQKEQLAQIDDRITEAVNRAFDDLVISETE